VGPWVVGSAEGLLDDTAAALGATTTPQLRSTWFSSAYWRMAAVATLLTLPFLFAAAVQALIRSDIAVLARAALGYLPLAILSIAIVAPLTTLLLAASDELCTWVSSAAGNESGHFLEQAGIAAGGLTALAVSPFLVFLIGLFTIAAAFALWIELLVREAAVYVIVLMLPLAFAALVWPARRIWAIRAVEILVALILSKFAIVAVLSLGGAAVNASTGHLGVTSIMAGAVLITLAAFSPWAMLRMVPLAELAAGAAGSLSGELRAQGAVVDKAIARARSGDEKVTEAMAAMTRALEAQMPHSRGPAASGPARTDHASPDPPAPNPGPASSSNDAAAADPEEPTKAERPWSEESVLELKRNSTGPPVFPHPEAE
jgi:hypothetical protein